MRVLWVVNIPCMGLAELAGLSRERAGSGGWLNAAIKDFEDKEDYEIAVVTTYPVAEIKKCREGNITYYLLGGGHPSSYDYKNAENIRQWEFVKKDFNPDIIQLWGSEFAHSLAAISTINNVPSIIYVQGIKSAIGKYYSGGMTQEELRDSRTWKTVLFRKGIKEKQREFLNHEAIEKKIYQLAEYVLGENSWCEANSLLLNPNLKYRVSHLPINRVFFNYKWSIETMKPHTIFCNASGYPVKGTHMLLKALAIVKQRYPDVVLNIPGMQEWSKMDFKTKAEGYFTFINKLVKKLGLEKNINFIGMIPHEEMARQIQNANAYVMCSCIENHSSSLIEALCVGAPCVSSVVGGVQDYVKHGVNGLLYRYEEHSILAQYIIDLFNDVDMCKYLSYNAMAMTRQERNGISVYEELSGIYNEILHLKDIHTN